jgi:hypothetical protein
MPPAARNSTTRILPIFSPTSGRRDEVPGFKGGEEGSTDAIRAIQEKVRPQYTSSPGSGFSVLSFPNRSAHLGTFSMRLEVQEILLS